MIDDFKISFYLEGPKYNTLFQEILQSEFSFCFIDRFFTNYKQKLLVFIVFSLIFEVAFTGLNPSGNGTLPPVKI